MTIRPAEVQELLDSSCEEQRMPGACAAWLLDGEAHFATFGTADVATGLPVTKETLFGIGSTSKTLTGTAVMALVEQGKLSLDDRVIKHLPDLPVLDEQARHDVTVGQLLDHTAGWIGDAVADTGWGDDALAESVPLLLALAPQQAPPGAHFSYNNTSFAVAGHLVAQLHQTSFERAIDELVLAPLGMTSTYYLPWEVANRPHAVGHIAAPDGPRSVPSWPTSRFLGPAGGAFSSAQDVMTWARYHLTGETQGKAPISEESRLLMQEQRSFSRGRMAGAGVSWLMGHWGDRRLIEHGGNLSNIMVSTFSMAPDSGLAVSVTGNSAGGSAVGTAIRDALLGPPSLPARTPLRQPDLSEYVGRYRAGQWDLEVVEVEGRLDFGMRMLEVDLEPELREVFERKRTRVTFIEPDLVAPVDDPSAGVGDFIRDPSGRIVFFRAGGRLGARLPEGQGPCSPASCGRASSWNARSARATSSG